jgi:hypothetical protein
MKYHETVRPFSVTTSDIKRWDQIIAEDSSLKDEYKRNFQIREYCYAGMWLFEQLMLKQCPLSLAQRIQYSAGKNSINQDPWKIHQEFLENYDKNEIIIKPSKFLN